ncbi:MAG TPA: ATP-binding protein [Chitinophagaceae bacterium]|nr:ATP-binding protein [Chitinophagaceae bacterium]
MQIKSTSNEEYIVNNSIFRIGQVVSVEGQAVKVKVDKGKNTSSILYKGQTIQNIAVGGYIKIKKGFSEMIGKIEGEFITEEKDFSKSPYKSTKDKINRILNIKILGFLERGVFQRGVRELPLLDNNCFLLQKEEFDEIHNFVGADDEPIEVGTLEYDDGQKIELGVNSLFASHIGIFGNTGSGKSYTLTKIYRELFKKFKNNLTFTENAKFFIIDFNGEYSGANTIVPNKKIYNLTTRKAISQINASDKIPFSENDLTDLELICIMADATEKTQRPFISRALKYYKKVEATHDSLEYFKNILHQRIRATLKMSNKDKAYTLIDYLSIIVNNDDNKNLIESIEWNNKNQHFMPRGGTSKELTNEEIENTELFQAVSNYTFPIDVLSKVIHFLYIQLIYDVYNDKAQNEHIAPAVNKLKSKKDDIRKVLNTEGSQPLFPYGQNLVVVNLNDVNLEIKKTLPLLLSKKLYAEQKVTFGQQRNKSLNLIIDEAHNILSKESFREAESWKDYRLETFEEIIKEGRKFGTFLTISSQRPSDISPTIISQLHNYFLHRLINNNDLLAVEKTIAYLDKVSADSIPNLSTGTCIIAGLLAQIPVVMKVNKITQKENQPISQTINLLEKWSKEKQK